MPLSPSSGERIRIYRLKESRRFSFQQQRCNHPSARQENGIPLSLAAMLWEFIGFDFHFYEYVCCDFEVPGAATAWLKFAENHNGLLC